MTTFGEQLRAWREGKGLTLYFVSKQTGIAQPNLTSIEKGRRPPSDEVLGKLCAVTELGLDIDTCKAWLIIEQYNLSAIERANTLAAELERHLDCIGAEKLLEVAEEVERKASGQ